MGTTICSHLLKGLSKLLSASHKIDGHAVGLQEILSSESHHVMYTRRPTLQEVIDIRYHLESLGMFPVLAGKVEEGKCITLCFTDTPQLQKNVLSRRAKDAKI